MDAASNARIRSMDIPITDKVFGMESGYVVNFTNRTFANFFHEELRVNIYDNRWAAQGTSKANRLRYYLQRANGHKALQTLEALWEYREAISITTECPKLEDAVLTAYFRIIQRLGGRPPKPEAPAASQQERLIDPTATSALPPVCWKFPPWTRRPAAMPSRPS